VKKPAFVERNGLMTIPLPSDRIYVDGKVFQQAWIEEGTGSEPEEEVQGMADLRDDEPEDWCEECFYNGPCGRKDCPVEIEHKATVKRLLKMQKRMDAEDAEAENGLFQ